MMICMFFKIIFFHAFIYRLTSDIKMYYNIKWLLNYSKICRVLL